MRRILPRVVLWCLIGSPQVSPVIAAPPSTREIREILKRNWDAVKTIEIRGEEFPSDENGRRLDKPGLAILEFETIIGPDGKRSHREIIVEENGKRSLSTSIRQDGQKRVFITPFSDDINSIKSVRIEHQEDWREGYRGPATHTTYLWAPGGRPLYLYLDDGATIGSERGDDGQERFFLHAWPNSPQLRILLDPDHGWLPKTIGSETKILYATTQYQRDNGIWFPSEGYSVQPPTGNIPELYSGFKVTTLRINRPVDPSAFNVTNFPAGVLIQDFTRGRSGPRGWTEAMRDLASGRPLVLGQKPLPSKPSGARRPPKGSWAPLSLGAAFVGLLALVFVVKFRSGRQAASGNEPAEMG